MGAGRDRVAVGTWGGGDPRVARCATLGWRVERRWRSGEGRNRVAVGTWGGDGTQGSAFIVNWTAAALVGGGLGAVLG